MQLFVQRLFDALSNGAVYAALAVALSMVYRSSAMLNFALGEMSMAATFLALVLSTGPTPLLKGTVWAHEKLGTPWNVWIVIPVVMVVATVAGVIVERVFVRPAERRSAVAVVSVTLGIGLFVNGGAAQLFGSRFFAFPGTFPTGPKDRWRIGGASLRYETVGIAAVLLGVLVVLALIQRWTKLGLAFRAVASNRDSAALSGVRVNQVLALGWGIAGALGALAGVLVANTTLVSTNMMSRLLVFGIAAATVGGLGSPSGAALGGIVLALMETMLGGYVPFIGGDVTLVTAILVLMIVLWFRPAGLFGRRTVARL